jgi:flagellar hook-associated protein 2
VEFSLSGLASGFDWKTMVDQLTDLERIPQQRLMREQAELFDRNSTYGSLETELSVLKSKVEDLASGDLFDQRKINIGDGTLLNATAAAGAAQGSHKLAISQLATASSMLGSSNTGSALHTTSDVSSLTLSSAPFRNGITDGTITVNGKRIDIASTQSLQNVFDAISTATSGSVTGTYNASTDAIQLSSASQIVLGSANDTSNFLQEAQLFNNGTGTVQSANALGTVQAGSILNAANWATTLSDGGSGAGAFKINGITISFSASSDSLQNVLERINESTAGVLATYDASKDRLQLTNDATGDLGVSLEDVTGNFLAASGLSGATLERGKNLQFSINDGATLTSYSNTADATITGVAGLSLTALQTGTTTVTVESDRTEIESGINAFISQFNQVQAFIQTHASSSTDTFGKIKTGSLFGEIEVESIASQMRSLVAGEVSGLDATLNHLSDIGISGSGYDNNLSVNDSGLLGDALLDNLDQVKALFQDATHGVGVALLSYIEGQIGDEGMIPAKVTRLTEQTSDIDTQIERMERFVQARKESLIESFVAMEAAQQKTNQQMSFLSAQLGTTAS